MLSASYSSDDTIAINVILMLIVAGIFIAILVWILRQISRQTRGIEEIYKLLYRMQSKSKTIDAAAQDPVNPATPSYMQELIDDEEWNKKQAETTEEFKAQNKTSPTNLIVGIVILGVVLVAVFIIAIVTT